MKIIQKISIQRPIITVSVQYVWNKMCPFRSQEVVFQVKLSEETSVQGYNQRMNRGIVAKLNGNYKIMSLHQCRNDRVLQTNGSWFQRKKTLESTSLTQVARPQNQHWLFWVEEKTQQFTSLTQVTRAQKQHWLFWMEGKKLDFSFPTQVARPQKQHWFYCEWKKKTCNLRL